MSLSFGFGFWTVAVAVNRSRPQTCQQLCNKNILTFIEKLYCQICEAFAILPIFVNFYSVASRLKVTQFIYLCQKVFNVN